MRSYKILKHGTILATVPKQQTLQTPINHGQKYSHITTTATTTTTTTPRSRGLVHRTNSKLILWNQEVHYRIHKSPTRVSILSQVNPDHIPTLFLTHPFQYYPPTTPRLSMCSLFLRFSHKNPKFTFPLPPKRPNRRIFN
jgi:hypothetical protein